MSHWVWLPLPAGKYLLNLKDSGTSRGHITEDSVNAGEGSLLLVVESSRTKSSMIWDGD